MKSKPANMKYTDLCKYIDDHLYERDENNNPTALRQLSSIEVENIYSYLYYIIIALSVKKRLMSNPNDYSEFAIEAAGRVFGRLVKKNQDFTYSSRNNKPVKSVLNYIKGCLGFLAISFREEHYNEVIKPERDLDSAMGAREYMEESVVSSYNDDLVKGIEETLINIPHIVNESLQKTIYKKKSKELNDLKLSFYISMLNVLTLQNKDLELTENRKQKKLLKQLSNRDSYICTWNDNKLITKPIIQLQTRKILLDIEREIEETRDYITPTQDVIEDILNTALPTYGLNQTEDD